MGISFFQNDGARGEPRPFAAHCCGGEPVLQELIDCGAVVAYEVNGVQYVRVPEHQWDNQVQVNFEQSVAGVTHAPDGAALHDLANSFGNMITAFSAPGPQRVENTDDFDVIPSMEWLQPSDTRVSEAHSRAMGTRSHNAYTHSSVRIEDIAGILGSDSRYPPPKKTFKSKKKFKQKYFLIQKGHLQKRPLKTKYIKKQSMEFKQIAECIFFNKIHESIIET